MMRGKAHVYKRDDINTDEILPARYMNVYEESEMGKHCMEDLDTNFVKKVTPGDFIVAGKNFGCGSSREHAIWSLRGAGVKAVFATSFARIFLRNAINNGFMVIEIPDFAEKVEDGAELEIFPTEGKLKNITTGQEFEFIPMPPFALGIMEKGGLLEYVKSVDAE